MRRDARIGVVGATGAVGTVTLELLAARGFDDVRALRLCALGRAAARRARRRGGDARGARAAATSTSSSSRSAPAPRASSCPTPSRGGAAVIDKSSAYRLQDGIPLVVPEVNGARALENGAIIANPNCCTIPLTCVLKPLHDAAGLARVRVATYQSVSGAGAQAMDAARQRGARRARPAHGLGVRRRGVRRGVEAARRDAEDHGAARAADPGDAACACR